MYINFTKVTLMGMHKRVFFLCPQMVWYRKRRWCELLNIQIKMHSLYWSAKPTKMVGWT